MANPLKGLNFKEILTEHGEKIAFGVVAVIGLTLIISSDWNTVKKTPSDLQAQSVKADRQLDNSKWAADERKKYAAGTASIADKVQTLLSRANKGPSSQYLTSYALANSSEWTLYPPESKIAPMVPGRVRALLADTFVFQIPVTEVSAAAPADTGDGKKSDDKAKDPKKGSAVTDFIGGSTKPKKGTSPDTGKAGGHDEGGAYAPPPDDPEGGHDEDKDDMYEEDGKLPGPGGHGGGKSKGGKKKKAEPKAPPAELHRFVVLRAIFDLREQLQRYAISVHAKDKDGKPDLNAYEGNLDLIKIQDFDLQRQEAPNGTADWSKIEWKPVSKADAVALLKRSRGGRPEVVDTAILNPVISMPLPPITWGDWRKPLPSFAAGLGTHPLVEDYQLSEKEQKEFEKFNEKARKELEKSKNEPAVEDEKFGGFADLYGGTSNVGQQRRTLLAGADFSRKLEADGADKSLIERWKKNASGNVLLFRFFDFSVRPGFDYRYRVRLKLRNPHYNLSRNIARLEASEKQHLWTEWSDLSGPKWDGRKVVPAPVSVEPDTRFGLTGVEYPQANRTTTTTSLQGRHAKYFPAAVLDLLHWHPKYGVPVQARLGSEIGTFLGGKTRKEIEVVNPAARAVFDAKVEFTTDELLVDVEAAPELDPRLHPDLNLERDTFKRKRQIGMFSRALVSTSDGRAAVVDPLAARKDFKDATEFASLLVEALKKLYSKDEGSKKKDALDGDPGESAPTPPPPPG